MGAIGRLGFWYIGAQKHRFHEKIPTSGYSSPALFSRTRERGKSKDLAAE